MKKSPKRYKRNLTVEKFYAYKEFIAVDGFELVFFIGLTNNNGLYGHNAMARFHANIPCWKEATDNLIREAGFDSMKDLHKAYPIKRQYGKSCKKYWHAVNKFVELNIEYPDVVCYNFIHCTDEKVDKYLGVEAFSDCVAAISDVTSTPQSSNVINIKERRKTVS